MEPREQRHAAAHDGRAARWKIYKRAEAAGRIRGELLYIATRGRDSEIELISGVYAVRAHGAGDAAAFLGEEEFTVGERGAVLHCGKNLPPAASTGDTEAKRDLHQGALSAT
jgi:hypothetical protein